MTRPINVGDLRTRLTLQAPTVSKDPGGAPTQGYTDAPDVPQVWSKWVYAHGEEHAQHAVKSVQRATVTIRYRSDVRTTWQVVRDGTAWQIISLDPIQDRQRWLEMVVERAEGSA